MYLRANPQRRRTEEEKEELRQKYKPGEQVLLRVAVQEKDSDDERMLAEVREMSLREVGVRAPGSYERGVRHRTAERRRDNDNTRQTRRHQHRDSSQQDSSAQGTRRQIGHQSSLRSLMSSSEIDSSEMEEEILQLVDEGWLDGIDLNTLDTSQVDELSERIADAYRRRHRHRSGAGAVGAEESRRPRDHSQRRSRERSHNRPNRSSATTEHSHHSSHPPVSRPRLLEAYPTGHSHQRRASSEQRRQTSPSPRSSAGRISSASQHQAARSATDLTERLPSLAPRPLTAELNNQGQRTTDPARRHGDRSRGEARSGITNSHNATASGETPARPEVSPSQPRPSLPSRASDPGHTDAANQPINLEPGGSRPAIQGSLDLSGTGHHASTSNHDAPIFYVEPSIECNCCKRQNIEYELHYNCSSCYDGNYNLCLQCYRIGRGCLHWYGFGYAALQRYQRDAKDLSQGKVNSPPHALIGQRYRRPMPESHQLPSSEGGPKRTLQDPLLRLESGAFCAICLEFANKCFWKCGSCNEGEWGFCNRCVNQGRCCTHPLLPVAHKSTVNAATSQSLASNGGTLFAPAPEHYSSSSPLFLGLSPPDQYVPLTLSTKCNICEYPIPPSSTRFHCPQCNDGDLNISTNSYLKLISDGRITTDNGDKGWRRCPSGHRMIVIGFEDSPAGQRRVIVKDLVGGHGLKNDGNNAEQTAKQEWSWQDGQQRHVRTVSKHAHEAQDAAGTAAVTSPLLRKYPPSGGLGMRVLALWSYWPRDEAQDELAFPRGAEIREAENINGDWFVGCYSGRMGLFPGNYVRVLDIVRS
ncbi:MAG: hypothetical protein Q9225_002757 [Loekoesia sp. 1 TL-2023]